jgi:tetratricopeptide (TPR) repeat protein
MARVFISHSSRDNEAARKIFDWLRAQGFEEGFLDIDKHQGIPPGARWEQTLYEELERAQAVILILTKNWFDSKWCFAEFAQARSRGKAIFPVIISPDGDQYVGDDLQKIKLWRDERGGLELLAHELTEVALQSQGGFDFPSGRAPYPGFFAFDEDDAAIYFGRDDDIRRLIQRLESRRIEGGRRFVAVLGESGTGKSSLLRAGIIPRLRRARRDWIVLSAFRPEEDPFMGLARSLRQAGIDRTSAQLAEADAEELAVALANKYDEHHAAILVAIDQFEEVFTRAPAERSAQFVALLARMLKPGLPFVVAATMRSDHLGDLQRAAPLATEFEEFSLRPMPVERIGEIIRGPARVAGVEVDEELVTRMTADARTTDALPLVAFALRRLYDDVGAHKHMTLAQYERLRDAAAGLSPLETIVRDTAGRVIADLAPAEAELKALREAFVPGLVRVNDEGGFVRQAAAWESIPEGARRLIAALAGPAARLLVIRDRRGGREVEVAHEALFRVWPLLIGWLNEEKEFLIGRNRLEKALADWQELPEADRDKGLLSGILLRRARQWLIEHPARFSKDEADFIRASDAAEEARRRQEEEQRRALEEAKLRQAETERDAAQRVQRRTRIAAVLLGLVALVAAGAGIFALQAERRASAEAARATAEAARANAETDRATRNLTIARETVDRVVLDVAQGLRDVEGMRLESVRTILTRVQAAVDKLAEAAPDDIGVQRTRAAMLTLFGDIYLRTGDMASAGSTYDAALTLRRRLVTLDGGKGDQDRDLCVMLTRYGDFQLRAGKIAAALALYSESLEVARRIALRNPDGIDSKADVWFGLVKVGDARMAMADTPGAVAAYKEALDLVRGLAAARDAPPERQRDLLQSLFAFGEGQSRLGNEKDAMATFEEALALARTILAKDTGNTQSRRDLVIALQKIGDSQLATGKARDALASFREALTVIEGVSATDPDNKDWQADLAIAHEKVGDAQDAEGDHAGALKTYEAQLVIARRLAEADPRNAIWQRGLSVCLERIGDEKMNLGDKAGAVAAYDEELGIAERLAAIDPDNLDWQRDLMVSSNKVANARVQTGDFAGGKARFEEGLKIARRLFGKDPASITAQTDLIICLTQVAIGENEDLARKGALIDEALGMMKKLSDAGQLPLPMNVMRGLLEKLKKDLAGLTEPPPEARSAPSSAPAEPVAAPAQ